MSVPALRSAVLIGTVLSCLTSPMTATGQGPIDIPERASGAAKVVVATATTVTPVWRKNAFGDELIVSEVGLQVEETLKGTPAGFALLEVEGGTLDGVTLRVSSLPTMQTGERGVFFLKPTGKGTFVPHLKGLGILKLDADDRVRGSSLQLNEIRTKVKAAR